VRRETGNEQSMQVRYDEGVAIHIGPKPCVAVRKDGGEASVGECIGQPLSLVKIHTLGADDVAKAEGNTCGHGNASARTAGVVEEPDMCTSSLRGNREIPRLTSGNKESWVASGRRGAVADDVRVREVRLRHISWEADEQGGAIRCGVGGVEAKGNTGQQSTYRAQDRESVSQALGRIRRGARHRKKEKFTALFHHITAWLLREAFFELKENAAPGVDGLRWGDCETDLERRLEDLHARLQRGAYRALPGRRGYIPKSDGQLRPLAVAA
jgi:hypothetical protein